MTLICITSIASNQQPAPTPIDPGRGKQLSNRYLTDMCGGPPMGCAPFNIYYRKKVNYNIYP